MGQESAVIGDDLVRAITYLFILKDLFILQRERECASMCAHKQGVQREERESEADAVLIVSPRRGSVS